MVNNTGVIEAQTVDAHDGTIKLLGDMQSGTVNVGGTLDASAPNGGNGGAIETSAAQVNIAPQAKVTTVAPKGVTGQWVIDPVDFTIGADGNTSGATLSALLVTNNVTISTLDGAANGSTGGTPPTTTEASNVTGNGDINVDQAVSWTASPSTTTLTLNAFRDVNINAAITATNGNLVTCCGRDVNVDAALTTTNGSMLLSAGAQREFELGCGADQQQWQHHALCRIRHQCERRDYLDERYQCALAKPGSCGRPGLHRRQCRNRTRHRRWHRDLRRQCASDNGYRAGRAGCDRV